MTSSSGTGENTRQPTLFGPEELAGRLLAAEIGAQKSSEELAAAGERAYLRLQVYLAPLIGQTGFDALWLRAMRLAQARFDAGDSTVAGQALPLNTSGLLAAVHGRDAVIVQHNLVIAFASFNRFLFSFIGEELGSRLIHQIWPTLSDDAENSHVQGFTE